MFHSVYCSSDGTFYTKLVSVGNKCRNILENMRVCVLIYLSLISFLLEGLFRVHGVLFYLFISYRITIGDSRYIFDKLKDALESFEGYLCFYVTLSLLTVKVLATFLEGSCILKSLWILIYC